MTELSIWIDPSAASCEISDWRDRLMRGPPGCVDARVSGNPAGSPRNFFFLGSEAASQALTKGSRFQLRLRWHDYLRCSRGARLTAASPGKQTASKELGWTGNR